MVGFIACFAAKIMTCSGKNIWIYNEHRLFGGCVM